MRFDDAIESHQKAAAALDEALQANIVNAKVIESMKLQREFHVKHIDLIRLKKSQYEKYKLAVEQQRLKNADFVEQRTAKDRIESVCDLQISIFKTLDDSDSLLDSLSNVGKRSPGSVSSDSGSNTIVEADSSGDGKLKQTKSEGSLIEDMHSLNHQLHILVYNLVSRCDQSQHELESMRERLKSLEKENRNQRKVSLPVSNKSSTDSSGKIDESPTNTIEKDIRRNSVTGEERKIVLPESSDLPPLELPEFDYSTFDDK